MLLGQAAMLLSFDVAAEAIDEHDHWHSHEHLPERLAIPGFLRGTRWTARQPGDPRYMVLYEVETLQTLTSPAYLERLNDPTPWTARMMRHYRGMSRGLCRVLATAGLGLGPHGLLLRFGCATGDTDGLDAWLRGEVVTRLPARPGLVGAHLLRGAATAAMTREQAIRGADAGVDTALVVAAYDPAALAIAQAELLGEAGLAAHGAVDVRAGVYQLHHSLSRTELDP
jgi:hypothetical protein